jgi:N-hydroxyarylamine O-acetyltransferase
VGDVDLDAYFERIGYQGPLAADLATLRALHRLHPTAIPFENLSTLLPEPIPLDTHAVQQKLIRAHRGGYCFEHNRLFADVLGALGFRVRSLAARVLWHRRPGPVGPRTHMVLSVTLGADTYLADVGFGGLTLTQPLRFDSSAAQATEHEVFRLVDEDGEFELATLIRGEWRSMYRFDLQEQLPIDFDVLNHFVATHPESVFRSTLMAARRTATGRYALLDNELTSYAGASEERTTLGSAAEIAAALAGPLGIRLPEGDALDAALARAAAARSASNRASRTV